MLYQGPDIFTSYRHKVVKACALLVFLLPSLLFIPQGARWVWCITFTLSNLMLLYEFFETLRLVRGCSSSLPDRILKCQPLGCVFGLKVIPIVCSWIVTVILGQLNVCARPIVLKVSEACKEQIVSIIALVPFRTLLPVIKIITAVFAGETESTPGQPDPKRSQSSRRTTIVDQDWVVCTYHSTFYED